MEVLAKYFVHGLAFSLLFLILAFMWGFLLGFLIVIGAIIGLIIGIAILIIAVGFLNGFLTEVIWEFETNSSFWNLLLHGLALLLLLLVVNVTIIVASNLVFPGTIAIAVTFILEAFADGYVAKTVAMWFPSEREGEELHPSQFGSKKRYRKYLYREEYKCGNCFWFGKSGCKRNERLINAEPCEDYTLKYYE